MLRRARATLLPRRRARARPARRRAPPRAPAPRRASAVDRARRRPACAAPARGPPRSAGPPAHWTSSGRCARPRPAGGHAANGPRGRGRCDPQAVRRRAPGSARSGAGPAPHGETPPALPANPSGATSRTARMVPGLPLRSARTGAVPSAGARIGRPPPRFARRATGRGTRGPRRRRRVPGSQARTRERGACHFAPAARSTPAGRQ